MELFSEIYSCYYRAMERVLHSANERSLSGAEIQEILSEDTFSESAVSMFPKLQNGMWPLLRRTESGYTTDCIQPEKTPFTLLQRSWIKSLLSDPRICLFLDDDQIDELCQSLSDIEPLYQQKDFYVFDNAADGDDYSNVEYKRCFRLLLEAIHQKSALSISYEGGKGNRVSGIFWPYKLEYSAKDEKFRAHCYRKAGRRKMVYLLNLGRIVSAEPADITAPEMYTEKSTNMNVQQRQVVLEITKERNALERCMVHFAHFEKRTEYDETTNKYTCRISYNIMDEMEVVIRVLSFGPTIKVLGPDIFLNEIRARVNRQSELQGYSEK